MARVIKLRRGFQQNALAVDEPEFWAVAGGSAESGFEGVKLK